MTEKCRPEANRKVSELVVLQIDNGQNCCCLLGNSPYIWIIEKLYTTSYQALVFFVSAMFATWFNTDKDLHSYSQLKVHCFLENSYILLDSFLATFDEFKEQLYFVVENKSLSLKDVITNINGFMKKSYFCFFCGHHFGGHGSQHKCR